MIDSNYQNVGLIIIIHGLEKRNANFHFQHLRFDQLLSCDFLYLQT